MTGVSDGPAVAEWTIESPSGRMVATVANLRRDASARRLHYRVELDGFEVLGWSPLGVHTESQSFVEELTFSVQSACEIDESYATVAGKRRSRHVRAREQTLRFANPNGAEIELVFRVSDDGVAWRYRLLGEGDATMLGEESGFRIRAGSSAWLLVYDRATQFGPAYERHVKPRELGERSSQENGFGYGALFLLPDSSTYLLLAEADLDDSYAGTHLADPEGNLYRVAFPGEGEGNGIGAVHPSARLPWTTPWRVAVIGDLATVFASTLVDDLSRPSASEIDPSWMRPGRSAWSWFSQGTGDASLQRQYVDLASELGWEYVLVDAHWDEQPEEELRALVGYAAERNVSIFLWYNSGGAHNEVPEPPRDRMSDPEIRRRELDRIAAWGIKGIKVDFFQSEKQDRIAQYLAILEDALERRLLVNFHGSTLPRGWQRTFPNLMTMEGVRGAEYYKFNDPPDAIHNVRLALTRNVVGSMDYTPVTFEVAWEQRGISYAHQVALAVVFESGIQHFAERGDADPAQGFRKAFADAPFLKTFFREVPSVWDESLLLEGSPDSHVVVARRYAERWYVAGLNGLEEPLRLELPLNFLREGSHALRLIASGETPTKLSERTNEIRGSGPLLVELGPKDGFTAIVD